MLWLAWAGVLGAQTPLENSDKPMRVPFQCTPDDSQAAGLNCSEEKPCPIFLELNGVESAGNRIFTSGDIHADNATLYSILLASDDAGKTWTEPNPRIRFASLDEIQFVDFENG